MPDLSRHISGRKTEEFRDKYSVIGKKIRAGFLIVIDTIAEELDVEEDSLHCAIQSAALSTIVDSVQEQWSLPDDEREAFAVKLLDFMQEAGRQVVAAVEAREAQETIVQPTDTSRSE